MTLRKISLVIVLILSACFTYAQSSINIQIQNDTDYDYNIVVGFNQAVTPLIGSSLMSFTVTHGTTYEAEYTFDENDVNVESVRCAYVSGGQVGTISINDGPGTEVEVAPDILGIGLHHFYFDTYDGQDEWEWLYFIIEP